MTDPIIQKQLNDRIQQLVKFNQQLLLQAHQKKAAIEIADKVDFSERSLKQIAQAELANRFHSYVAQKKEGLVQDNKSSNKRSSVIITPHPIGNLSTAHGILIDWMARINHVDLRILLSQDAKKYPNSQDRVKYQNPNYRDIQLNKFKKEMMLESQVRLKDFEGSIKELNKRIKILSEDITKNDKKIKELLRQVSYFQFQMETAAEFVDQISKVDSLTEMLEVLANEFVELGLDIKVISKPQQSSDARARAFHLRGSESDMRDRTWDKSDADGDKRGVNEILGDDIIGKTLAEIHGLHDGRKKQSDSDTNIAYEPRISSKVKRGVDGAVKAASEIAGAQDIKSVSDLLDPDKFAAAYKEFEEFVRTAKHGEGADHPVNSHLDFILRATLPNYTNADGLVLSDFPTKNGEQLLARLLFIKQATNKFLFGNKFKGAPQTFFPLCENKEAIENLQYLIGGILKTIQDRALEIKNNASLTPTQRQKDLENLKNTFTNDGKLIFGAFFGPSDLTANMGGIAIAVINNQKHALEKLHINFQNEIRSIINFEDIALKQQYGKGSSPYRGANQVFPGPRTMQGQPTASTDRFLQKLYNLSAGGSLTYVHVPNDVLELCVANHRRLINDDEPLGIISKEYNALAENPKYAKLLVATIKDYSNNQGTRGGDGKLKPFEKHRAIGLGTKRACFGLVQTPGLPYNWETGEIEWESKIFKAYINAPAGFTGLIDELFQLCVMDTNRSKILGFSSNAIRESLNYANATVAFLQKELGIAPEVASSHDHLIGLVVNMAKKLSSPDNDIIKSDYLKNKAELFSHQIPMIREVSNDLTQQFSEMNPNAEIVEQAYAEVGVSLNIISNWQLPVVATELPNPKEKCQL